MSVSVTGAKRDNEGKPRYMLVPHKAETGIYKYLDERWLNAVSRVMEVNAEKYGLNNWRRGLPIRDTLDSLYRHCMAIERGLRDEDHAAHLSCNAMFLWVHLDDIAAGRLTSKLALYPPPSVEYIQPGCTDRM